MGDENPIHTLGDYSKPSHESYRNPTELPAGNNMVPLRFDTIRTVKLRNDNLMFQQHHGESSSEAWTCFKDLHKKVPHHGMSISSQDEPLTNRPVMRDAWNSRNKDGSRTGREGGSKAMLRLRHSENNFDASIEIKAYLQVLKESRSTVYLLNNKDNFAEGMHAVPPPMIGNYMPSGPDVEVDDSKFTYGPKQTQLNESESLIQSLNVESQPKVWSDAPIIEEYESDSDDECVVIPTKQKVTPSFANQQVKTPRENVKKEMARKAELNNGWNNVQRVNKQNQFVPSAVLTRTGIILVNTARTSGKLLLIPHQVVIGDHKDTMVDPNTMVDPVLEIDYPHRALKNKGIVDSGCSRHMTGNKAYLAEFQDFNGGPVAFGGIEGFNIIGGLACLIAKATTDESNKWHRRKQHKASCKAKTVSSISHSLQLLHMDLFGPTSVRSLNHKTYCLVITDDFSRFSWVFFLRTKDETSAILKDFIRQIENQLNQKVKTIRSDNGTEFKNKDVIEFCGLKGIKREYNNARTLQQNGVAERKNRTLIEAARTMLADSFLPNTFWAEAVSTACYVLNRVLVTKPHNKTPYELLTGKLPIISYIRPFGCHVTILNTIDHLGKFAGKSDEGFLVGYSLQSKAFRVYNLETKRVEENLHITFLENKPNVAGKGPTWLFDLDYLTDSMNYHPVRSENQANLHAGQQEANQNAGTEDIIDAGDSEKEDESAQDCFVLPIWPSYSSTITPDLKTDEKREGPREEEQVFMDELERLKRQEKEANEEAEALQRKFRPCYFFKKAKENKQQRTLPSLLIVLVSLPQHGTQKISEALEDESWVDAIKRIVLVRIQKDWVLIRFALNGRRLFGYKVGQEEGIDYDEVLAPVARLEAIRIFLAFASYMGFIVYQMDVKSAFFYGKIDEEDKYVARNPEAVYFANVRLLVHQLNTQKAISTREEEANVMWKFIFIGPDWLLIYYDWLLEADIMANPNCGHWKILECLPLTWNPTQIAIMLEANLVSKSTTMVVNFLAETQFLANARKQTMCGYFYTRGRIMFCWQALRGQNPVYKKVGLGGHSKTKHIAISVNHFIEMLIEIETHSVLKIHTDDNVADLLTKAFDHNMVAYFEKSEGNAEFHEIIHFLKRSFIHHALTISPASVSISEASIRSEQLFDELDGIDSLPNQTIFDAIQQMGVALSIERPSSSERPSEAQPTPSPAPTSEPPHEPQTDSSPAHTSEVPLEQQTDPSPRPSPTTTIPDSIPETSGGNLGGHSSSDKSLSGNEGEMTLQSVYDLCLSLCAQVTDQAKEIQNLKAQIKKLKKQAKPVIHHHRAWLKSSLKQRLTRKSFPKKHRVHKESVSKQGRKFAKGEPSVQRDPLFDELPEDTVDHMETENAQDEGRTRDIVDEDKEIEENVLSTEDVLSTDKDKVSTDKEKVSTDRPIVSTDGSKVSTDRHIEGTDEQVEGTEEHNEGTEEQTESTDGQRKGTEDQFEEGSATQATQTPTSTIFGDDETIAKVLLNMSQAKAVSREKEKGVELKDIEEADRPRPTSTRSLLTLKPLPKIDPKDKGKK
ncbi:putative ribonuclease H-like domain-containing protein, partial [Tanacetum coccineum]